jgi:hypothetical protein
LGIYVRNVGSPAAYESYKFIAFSIVADPPATGATLTANLMSPQMKGTSLVLTATGQEGGSEYEYQFLLSNNGGKSYVPFGPYSTRAYISWDTSSVASGKYTLGVYVRNSGSTAEYQAFKSLPFVIM